jgi:hypothetical protein
MDEMSKLMMECHAVRAGRIKEIPGLRQRSKDTGLSEQDMRLTAEATDVDVVTDGDELKIVPASY